LIGEIKIIKKHVFGETTDSSGLLCTVTVGEWIVDFSLVCQIWNDPRRHLSRQYA